MGRRVLRDERDDECHPDVALKRLEQEVLVATPVVRAPTGHLDLVGPVFEMVPCHSRRRATHAPVEVPVQPVDDPEVSGPVGACEGSEAA